MATMMDILGAKLVMNGRAIGLVQEENKKGEIHIDVTPIKAAIRLVTKVGYVVETMFCDSDLNTFKVIMLKANIDVDNLQNYMWDHINDTTISVTADNMDDCYRVLQYALVDEIFCDDCHKIFKPVTIWGNLCPVCKAKPHGLDCHCDECKNN